MSHMGLYLPNHYEGYLLMVILRNVMCEVQVLKALVLGEEERGQSQYQVMCFVTKFQKGDFITADAMAKLRQKNPSTIRSPEEDRGKENYTMTGWVLLDRAGPISRHIAPLCSEAQDSTYARDVDLKAWAELPAWICTDSPQDYFGRGEKPNR
ncbi:out at first protein [Culex quinquefasciatus]|uniref:Out at first protein n=1 Tax=Culex quinquefasciatus TaxID=7176 RepID=B0WCJ5_CULQU|nr:out at first protein [Culex quinquefasciatus]|eukprot:XP_001846429.1 out at first protein [Culex quinquefasciatus]